MHGRINREWNIESKSTERFTCLHFIENSNEFNANIETYNIYLSFNYMVSLCEEDVLEFIGAQKKKQISIQLIDLFIKHVNNICIICINV